MGLHCSLIPRQSLGALVAVGIAAQSAWRCGEEAAFDEMDAGHHSLDAALDEEPLDLRKFVRGAARLQPPLSQAQAEFAFRALDVNRDGVVTKAELLAAVGRGDYVQPTESTAAATTTVPARMQTTTAWPRPSALKGRIPPGQPEMTGKVQEKTIWAYWYHETDCPSASRCQLPAAVELCSETVRQNRGSFDYIILHRDELPRYISRLDLPLHFDQLRQEMQKDAVMNAVLARYGGVALDITSILFRPLDDRWDQMVAHRATFSGYMYRMSGRTWDNAETTVVWFLMSRKQGLFTTAVTNQVIGLGDRAGPPEKSTDPLYYYRNPYFAMGDQTLTPILRTLNDKLPSCTDDATVPWHDMCPEFEGPKWNETARTDVRILLREPREGPQLPFAFLDDFSMGLWHVDSDTSAPGMAENSAKVPECFTQSQCWQVFLKRFWTPTAPGEVPLMGWVKLFDCGGRLAEKSRQELLGDQSTFFYSWLKLAGLNV